MARQEQDREDLLGQATALVARAEFQIVGQTEPLVVGFRRDDAASFFFGPDPVFQFTPAGLLRRAYWRGYLWKAEAGRLVRLDRQRDDQNTHLVRQTLSDSQQSAFLHEAADVLAQLLRQIRAGQVHMLREVPSATGLLVRVEDWLGRNLDQPLQVAADASLARQRPPAQS